MTHLMLDLETWGTRPGCAIRSVGAVAFDPAGGDLGDEFYVNVSRESCESAGLHVDADTAKWWDRQSADAVAALTSDQQDLKSALQKFRGFFARSGAEEIWSQGANFDQPIVEAALHAVGLGIPWRFYHSRCTRTIYAAAGLATWHMPKREGTAHHALDDAKHQARCVQLAYRKLGLGRIV